MTVKERILATLAGKPVDVLPFVPRLDIWYNANSKAGTLPGRFKTATLREMADELELGYHAIIPDFCDLLDDGDVDVGLGLYHLKKAPYRIKFHNIERKVERLSEGRTRTAYTTPKGTLTTTVCYDDSMKSSGVTLRVITEHVIKGYEDFDALAYLLENAEVTPSYEEYTRFKEEYIGDRGVAVALSAMFACPMHYLVKELMAIDTFYYTTIDYPDETEAFCQRIAPFCNSLFDAALNSPAEVILSGANYDTAVTAPPMFGKHIMPELKLQADKLHAKGKFLATHTDGENTGLLPHYVAANIDIADSICPAPLTRISLEESRRVFDGKITIWGGVPSICMLESTMNDYEFEKYIDNMFQSLGKADHLILSIADTVPPAAKFDRILHLAKKCREFGPVGL